MKLQLESLSEKRPHHRTKHRRRRWLSRFSRNIETLRPKLPHDLKILNAVSPPDTGLQRHVIHRQPIARLFDLLRSAALAIAATIGWLAWPTAQIDVSRFSEVRKGMTLQEVEAIVGGPPGVYCAGGLTGNYWRGWDGPFTGDEIKKTGAREWVGKEWSMLVFFGPDGRVTSVDTGLTTMRPPFLDRVRVWMGLADPERPRIYPVSDLSIPLLPVEGR